MVFILWGRPAQSKKPMLTNRKHLILEAPHPEPLVRLPGILRKPSLQQNKPLSGGTRRGAH